VKSSIPVAAAVVFCIGLAALLLAPVMFGAVGTALRQDTSMLTSLWAGDTVATAVVPQPVHAEGRFWERVVDKIEEQVDALEDEKALTAEVPLIPVETPTTAEPTPVTTVTASKEKTVREKEPKATPSPAATTMTPAATPTATSTTPVTTPPPAEPTPSETATTLPTPTPSETAKPIAYPYFTDTPEPTETTPTPKPTLEREVAPRPNATLSEARLHPDQPFEPSTHPLASQSNRSSTQPELESETPAISTLAPYDASAQRDGLVIEGIGMFLSRTPGDVAVTENGSGVAKLDRLLDPAMHASTQQPRVAFEGETFTVTVTAEARNVTIPQGTASYVVLAPPTGETGVYEIERKSGPTELSSGERGVWEFAVYTRTGRIVPDNLTPGEENWISNLTSIPEAFSFHAYASTEGQASPSIAVSDPVIALQSGNGTGTNEAPEDELPAIYAHARIVSPTLRSSETMTEARDRGVSNDVIYGEALQHLAVLQNLDYDDIKALYADEEQGRQANVADSASSASSSPIDQILGIFHDLIAWFGDVTGSPAS
jgi:hypothetical protein